MEDGRVETELQGESAGLGALSRLREVLGEQFTGCTRPTSARHEKRGIGAGGRQAQDVQDGVSVKGRTKALPSLGV